MHLTSEEINFWLPVSAVVLTTAALLVTYLLWKQPPNDD